MMVPPLFWVHGNGFTPQHRTAEAQSGHNTTQTHQAQVSFFFFFEGGSASEDQTYRQPPVTHHHYISAQYHHIPEVTLSRGSGRRTGKRGGGGTSLSVTCSQLVKHGALHCPKCWPWQHTYREGVYNGSNQNQYSVAWLLLLQAICVNLERMF